MRGESLSFASASFDVVVAADVLEHVDDLPRVLGEVSRVLRPGGCFLFDTINRTWLARLILVWLGEHEQMQQTVRFLLGERNGHATSIFRGIRWHLMTTDERTARNV